MPGCAAIGCNNRSEKGFTMKCFPRDPLLRQIWKDRVGRADWEPSNNSFLCSAHFAPSQWMVTQCGRWKLRKGAVPSIFRVVSTRKSPNKRRRSGADGKSEEEDFGVEIVEDDDDNYVYLETPGRLQNFGEESIVFLDSENSPLLQNMRVKEAEPMNNVYQIITTGPLGNLQHENLIVISDDNSTFVNDTNSYIIVNNENEDVTNQIQPIEIQTSQIPFHSRIKVEVKDETDGQLTADEIYNEVESNMERIYEGINSDESSQENLNSEMYVNESRKNQIKTELHKLDSQNDSVTDDESVNEEAHNNIHFKNSKSNNGNNNRVVLVENKGNFSRQGVEMPNLKAAIQRKRKARAETMKSIEKFMSDSVKGTQEQNQNSSDSEFSSANSKRSKRSVSNKFSGEIEEVSEIMRDLTGKPSMECSFERNKNGGSSFTSVNGMENSTPKIIKTERVSNSDSEGRLSDELVKTCNKFPTKKEVIEIASSDSELIEDDFEVEAYNQHPNPDQFRVEGQVEQEYYLVEDHDYQEQNRDHSSNGMKKNQISDSDCRVDSSDLYYDLKLKIEQQKGTIMELTDQLSTYKNMGAKLQKANEELKLKNREVAILTAKLHRKENTQGRIDKNSLAMQALIKDLTHKVKTIEDVNRRLSRSISVEHQNKKNLEYQVKNREKTIKELNWKVEKASKLLERAERNSITYKKRVNNMRSLIKRKHLDIVSEQKTPFDIMFSDFVKHEFSTESLRMASEVHKSCGTSGYEALIKYSFPLPSLRTLRRRSHKNVVSTNGSRDSIDPPSFNDSDLETFDRSVASIEDNQRNPNLRSDPSGIVETNTAEQSSTVQGMVQDIFDEDSGSELLDFEDLMHHDHEMHF